MVGDRKGATNSARCENTIVSDLPRYSSKVQGLAAKVILD